MFSKGRSNEEYGRVSDMDILSYYFGIDKLPTKINSPLREDKKPSFGMYTRDGESVYFVDFATGDRGSIVKLMSLIWNMNMNETIDRIRHEIGKKEHMHIPIIKLSSSSKAYTRSGIEIRVKKRDWEKHDIEYWESYGISQKWLEFGDVYPISNVILKNGNDKMIFGAEKYAYAYIERKDGKVSIKVYQPFSKVRKWLNGNDGSVWELWSKIPQTGNNLIITSSRKDALCIWENSGIPSISLQAEGYMPKKHVVDELKNRYINIFVLYDNDFSSQENHGMIFGKKMADTFDLKMISIPTKFEAKDTSDFCKKYGREETKKLILKLTNYGV